MGWDVHDDCEVDSRIFIGGAIMRSDRAPVFVGIDVVPSKGGPFKSLGFFRRALGGRVMSFTHPDDIPDASGEVTHVTSVGGRLGRMFLAVGPQQLARADVLLDEANLLSCHILFRHSAHWVRSQARKRRIPYWVVPHGCLDPYVFTYRGAIKRAWMRAFGRRILAGAAHVIFSTQREMEKARVWLTKDNARVVRWPVELAGPRVHPNERTKIRSSFGIPVDAKVVLFLGRLHPMKRPVETLTSFAAAGHGLHLVFAGPEDGVSRDALTSSASRLGVAGRVTVLPAVYAGDKERLLSAVDGFVSLSIRENFNHSAAEAMASGLPVLLSTGNDLGHEIAHRDCGWILDEDGPPAWEAGWAGTASATPAEWSAKGARGRSFTETELGFSHFAAKLSGLYAEAVGGI
jgi:glycosyltransferase involved in cell wall biosynthesis